MNKKQSRWVIYLSGFDFDIKYQAGSRNLADSLSRKPNYIAEAEAESNRSYFEMPTFAAKLARAKSTGVSFIEI